MCIKVLTMIDSMMDTLYDNRFQKNSNCMESIEWYP
jgi:hypothetical protein